MAKLGKKIGQIDIHKKGSSFGEIVGGIFVFFVIIMIIGAIAG